MSLDTFRSWQTNLDLICQDNKNKYTQKEKLLEITVDNKLDFTSYVKKVRKKANQNLHVLTRVKH